MAHGGIEVHRTAILASQPVAYGTIDAGRALFLRSEHRDVGVQQRAAFQQPTLMPFTQRRCNVAQLLPLDVAVRYPSRCWVLSSPGNVEHGRAWLVHEGDDRRHVYPDLLQFLVAPLTDLLCDIVESTRFVSLDTGYPCL
jgi:hypothetical protein